MTPTDNRTVTPKMIEAGIEVVDQGHATRAEFVEELYTAMHEARPEPSPLPDGLVERLHSAIKHGDQDHRDWLLEAIGAFFVGQPIPEPRGKGNKEAEITRLQADNADLRALLETGREYAIEAANDCGAKDEMFDQIMRDIGRMDAALQRG